MPSAPTEKKKKLNQKRLFLLASLLFLLSIFAAGCGAVLASISSVPAFDPKNFDTNATTLLYDKNGQVFARIHGAENRIPVKISQIKPHVRNAFLAIEDVRFYEHHGVSLRDIVRAVWVDLISGEKVQGASTITQQLVKLTFLTPEKTFKRKIQEMYLAIRLEQQYSKDEILEMYLNRIYFGQGAYGIQAAAQTYFSKNVEDLTVLEAATLAAIPKSPTYYDPIQNPDNALKRRNLVLDNMAKYGFISQEEAERLKKEGLNLKPSEAKSNYRYPFFVDYITDRLVERYGSEKVFNGGLRVYTTLDPKIQAAVEEIMADPNNFPASLQTQQGLQPQAAAVVIEAKTGYIRAMVGGRNHVTRRQLNRALTPRQPGSAFKPIIAYGPAIEDGKGSGSVVDDAPISFPGWVPKNFDRTYRGLITYQEALTNSVNIAAIQILKQTGFNKAFKFAQNLGITTLITDPKAYPNDVNLNIAIGGLTQGVSPLSMAGAYGAFANGGIYIKPISILRVEDKDGRVIDEFEPQKKLAMKETTAYIMTKMMESVVNRGTGQNARLPGWPVAGKTGTTDQGKDVWFVGYTPVYVGAVWIGYDIPRRMDNVYGGTYPAKIWQKIMARAHEGLKPVSFSRPANVVEVTVCSKSGLLPGPACPRDELTTGLFAAGSVPSTTCDVHVTAEVCTESNALATPACPSTTTRSFIKRKTPYNKSLGTPWDAKEELPSTTCPLHQQPASSPPDSTQTSAENGNQTKPPSGSSQSSPPTNGTNTSSSSGKKQN